MLRRAPCGERGLFFHGTVGVVSVVEVFRGCPAPKQHHPNEKHDLTHKVDIRVYAPVQGKALLSLRARGPDLKGKGNKTPKR